MKDPRSSSSSPSRAAPPAPDPSPVEPADAVRGVGVLAGELVHALRNPVSALRTSIELLTGGLADASDVPQLHRVMLNQLTKLDELLGRCRELARLGTLALAPAQLDGVVRGRVDARRADAAARGIALGLEAPPGTWPVRADEAMLGLAFDAVLVNALEAVAEGGTVAVALAREGASARVTVQDTGVGIPAPTLPNVFRVFFTTKKGASGMGLALARQVLLAHGAAIELASEHGRGTQVTVRVPLVAE